VLVLYFHNQWTVSQCQSRNISSIHSNVLPKACLVCCSSEHAEFSHLILNIALAIVPSFRASRASLCWLRVYVLMPRCS
jgi:hypothetical protein